MRYSYCWVSIPRPVSVGDSVRAEEICHKHRTYAGARRCNQTRAVPASEFVVQLRTSGNKHQRQLWLVVSVDD